MPHSFTVHVEDLVERSTLVVDLPTADRLFICRMRLWSTLETPIEENQELNEISDRTDQDTGWA